MISAYYNKICYKPSADHANADGLSRLPMSHYITEVPGVVFRKLESLPIRATQIRQWTDTDPVLSRVCQNLLSGWVNSGDPELQPYQS